MIRITDYKEKYKQLEKENDNVYLIRWDYEDDKEIDPETRIESESPLGTWTYERLYYTPSIDAIQNMILSYMNNQIDNEILNNFVWNDHHVWLSTENQFNYKTAYDLAVQTNGASLPVTFKFGTSANPTYHKFETVEDLSDFYLKATKFISDTLQKGWNKKDSIDWSKYSTNEGTKEDPIVYVPGMVLELGKYYIEGGIIYMCHKDSESIMKGNLKDYVDTYLTLISK